MWNQAKMFFIVLYILSAAPVCYGVAPSVNDAPSGVFLMKNAQQEYQAATLIKTEASIQINGLVAHVTLKQQFFNPGPQFSEGTYAFPLPDNAAVNNMEMLIGQRRIKGEIKEKQQAKKIYQKAAREGKRASLVEQHRPNLFTTKVANIPATESLEVSLSYVHTLDMDEGRFDFKLPTTVTPRYTPPGREPSISTPQLVASQGTAQTTVNPLSLNIVLDAGFDVERLRSPYHGINTRFDGQRYHIRLSRPQVPMNRDFVLHWNIAKDSANPLASAAFYTETIDEQHYGLLMLTPPVDAAPVHTARDITFIIDTSGSMSGTSITQAKQSLLYALEQLQAHERFNIIEFNNQHRSLFSQSVEASDYYLEQARQFVEKLHASGGTNMFPALQTALKASYQQTETSESALKQIIFITDGAISNEAGLFSLIHQQLGDTRLFTVGIGSAPNHYFMRKAAEFGRGSFTHIGKTAEVAERMSALFKKLSHPVVRDIAINFEGTGDVELYPGKVPDLYQGKPLLVAMKFSSLPDTITVNGVADLPWSRRFSLGESRDNKGISTIWARSKIGHLMDQLSRGAKEETIRQQVLEVALPHRLSSRYTSFVAVEQQPIRPQQEPLKKQAIPSLRPSGQSYPQTATGLYGWLLTGLLLLGLHFRYRS